MRTVRSWRGTSAVALTRRVVFATRYRLGAEKGHALGGRARHNGESQRPLPNCARQHLQHGRRSNCDTPMTYTHGHHESVLRSHKWRTVDNSAAYLAPYLTSGTTVLDVGCG